MSNPKNEQRVGVVMVVVMSAAASIYFFINGKSWSPAIWSFFAIWAFFAICAAWIIRMNVRRDAGLETEESYLRWKLRFGRLIVLALLFSPLWTGSLWGLITGIILCIFWLEDYQIVRERRFQSKLQGI